MPEQQSPAPEVNEVKLYGKGRFGKWLENFWYHYKVHTIIALVLVITVTICLVQCFTKPKQADFEIQYFGHADLRPTDDNTILADLSTSLSPVADGVMEDEDDEASVKVSFYTIVENTEDANVKNLSKENRDILKNYLEMPSSGYGYLFLFDEEVYGNKTSFPYAVTEYLTDLSTYLPEGGSDIRLTEDKHGVYIHSTPLADLPGVKELPEDTILALHTLTFFMDGDLFALCEDFIRACLSGQ